jgi:hypothetical protein
MKLPNREQAYVPRRKLTEYLLSQTHPVGKAKARLFRCMGFDEGQVERLEQALLAIAHRQVVEEEEATRYGVKYSLEGFLLASGGPASRVRTVWLITPDDPRPRFITAYPI